MQRYHDCSPVCGHLPGTRKPPMLQVGGRPETEGVVRLVVPVHHVVPTLMAWQSVVADLIVIISRLKSNKSVSLQLKSMSWGLGVLCVHVCSTQGRGFGLWLGCPYNKQMRVCRGG